MNIRVSVFMQIQPSLSVNTNHNNSFGATKLDSINLLKRVGKDSFTPIKANFNLLNFDNKDDVKLICQIKNKWADITTYGNVICKDFLERLSDCFYFAIEALDGKESKITNLAEVEIKPGKTLGKNTCYVNFLQSAPNIAKKADTTPIKGSGELAMYEIVKFAKKTNCKSVKLTSSADSFYEKLGFKVKLKEKKLNKFELKESKFKDFMKHIEKKYDLKNKKSK